MRIGWDSKADTFFVTDLTDAEAGALQGVIGSLFSWIQDGIVEFDSTRLESDEVFNDFLCNLQNGLLIAKQLKTQILEEQDGN